MNKELLNEILKEMDNIQTLIDNYDIFEAVKRMKSIERNYLDTDLTSCYIDEEEITEIVKQELESNDWSRVACLLSDIRHRLNDPMYEIGGDSNITWITRDNVQCTFLDLKQEIDNIKCC